MNLIKSVWDTYLNILTGLEQNRLSILKDSSFFIKFKYATEVKHHTGL